MAPTAPTNDVVTTQRNANAAKAEARAWREYLDETKHLPAHRYDMVEAWAWLRLRKRLEDARMRAARRGGV